MKKGMALLLSLLLLLPMASCTPTGKQPAMRIAVITSLSDVDDGSFNQNIYEGVHKFLAEGGSGTVTAVRESTGTADAAVKKVESLLDRYDVLVCCGFQFAGIGEVAQTYPQKRFLLVDAWPSDGAGNAIELANVYAMMFAEEEGGFYAGLAAAMESVTGKVAVVSGMPYPSNLHYQYGFLSGVYYAKGHYGQTVQPVELAAYAGVTMDGTAVGGNYIGSFDDKTTGKQLGLKLIAEGCDVLFASAGNSGGGVFAAAKESTGVFVIGCDTDQYQDGNTGDGRSIVLTSAIKRMDINVKTQLFRLADGSFAGGNVLLRTDTDSVGYISQEGRQQMSADTLVALQDAYDKIKSGALVPASGTNGVDPQSFLTK